MNDVKKILQTLRKVLKSKGIVYRQLARDLELSETSIKRIFSQGNISLERLEAICQLLDISVFDLIKHSESEAERDITMLTLEQEKFLADHPKQFLFYYLLRNGWSKEDIQTEFHVSAIDTARYLLLFDELELIHLYPGDEVKIFGKGPIIWRKNGPVWKAFEKQIKQEFLSNPFHCFSTSSNG